MISPKYPHQYPTSNIWLLLVSPASTPSITFSYSSCFPHSLCGKTPHVCLVSEEVNLSNTHRAELSWSDSSTTRPLEVTVRQNTAGPLKTVGFSLNQRPLAFFFRFTLQLANALTCKVSCNSSITPLVRHVLLQSIYSQIKQTESINVKRPCHAFLNEIIQNHHRSQFSV